MVFAWALSAKIRRTTTPPMRGRGIFIAMHYFMEFLHFVAGFTLIVGLSIVAVGMASEGIL